MKVNELITEMAKRASMDDFYAAAKKKYGAAAVKDIKWADVVTLARELDVTIPAAAHKNKTGRGRVNLVPDGHADTKAPAKAEPKKEEPKAAPKKEEPKAAAKEVNLEHVANQIYDAFKRHPMGRRIYGHNAPEKQGNGEYMFDVRDWGDWEVPSDEEDDGDYDWKKPTAATRKAYRELAEQQGARFGVKVEVSVEEKNWLMIYVGKKK